MSLALILAAVLASSSPALDEGGGRPDRRIDRSLSDSDRLAELRIDVTAAYDRRQIDKATAAKFYYGIERIRRQMIRMGIQVGYRQRVRLRQRIDALYARWAAQRLQEEPRRDSAM